MAPIPQNETKEPDKTEKTDNNNDMRPNSDFLDDLNNSVRDLDSQDSNVSTLDDGQLKALLDEAINYKTPKDREGKSRIFKVLLQQAETEERNARAASASGPQLARYYNTSARQRNKASCSATPSLAASSTAGGSLQDLLVGKKPLRRKRDKGQGGSEGVSGRAREGGSLGSLPTVPTGDDLGLKLPRGTRGRLQSEGDEEKEEHRVPRIRYTSRATLEVEALPPAPVSVDKPVAFSQLEGGGAQALQLEAQYSSVRCLVDEARGALPAASAGALAASQYRLVSVAKQAALADKFSDKKGVDENCNSLPSSTDSKKKKKCSKVDRNVTVLKSENLPGHRADIIESIDLLVKFIEDDTSTSKTKKSLNHKLETKKRRVKKTSTSVKKSNSLEEISTSKLEDLMLDDSKSKKMKNKSISEDGEVRKFEMDELADDFRVVIKKKKHKKRLLRAQQQGVQEPPARREQQSAPASDKSDSSDLDSVHSLPTQAMPTHSYAEIARAASHNHCQVTVPAPATPLADEAPRRRARVLSRPAVIILDESAAQVAGLTFGFELNPQLLRGPEPALEAFKRYFAPEHSHMYNHDKIVTYVGRAWDDALHDAASQFYHSDMV